MFNVDTDQLDRNLVFVAASIVKILGDIFLNIWGGGPAWTAPPGEKIEHDDLAFVVRKEDVFAVSVSLMHRMLKAGLDLSPYMLAQGVIVFGCLALYAYTPIYPRLVFSLTWNLFFALVQLFFAASAVWMHRWLNQRPISGEVAV